MGSKMNYRQEGYQQGYKDAKRTNGKTCPKYRDIMVDSNKDNLSSEESFESITGWHDGFADYMAEIFRRIVNEEGLATEYLSDLYK